MEDIFFKKYFDIVAEFLHDVDLEQLELFTSLVHGVKASHGKIIVAGNGGSAAMSSHVSVDFLKAANVRAINFNEADLITCFANDFGYEHWVEKAIEFYADPQDLVVLISSSGQSPNIINAANRAKSLNLPLVTLSGFAADNPLRQTGDLNFWIDSEVYNVVEMVHHIWLLAVVDKVSGTVF